MLRKLLKHELRAMGRIMLPLFVVLFPLSVFMGMAIRLWDRVESLFVNGLFLLLSLSYGFSLLALFVVVLVLMVSRFRNNYLRDEGYVMFTLPVSVHQLVWSKALSAAVWFLATLLAASLSGLFVGFIATFSTGMLGEILSFFRQLWAELSAYYALNGAAIFLETVLVSFVGYMSLCFLCYASLAIGHSFARHKMLLSIVLFFGFWTALQLLSLITLAGGGFDSFFFYLSDMDALAAYHTTMFVSLAVEVLTSAVFYFTATHFLQQRLNLE